MFKKLQGGENIIFLPNLLRDGTYGDNIIFSNDIFINNRVFSNNKSPRFVSENGLKNYSFRSYYSYVLMNGEYSLIKIPPMLLSKILTNIKKSSSLLYENIIIHREDFQNRYKYDFELLDNVENIDVDLSKKTIYIEEHIDRINWVNNKDFINDYIGYDIYNEIIMNERKCKFKILLNEN